MRVRIFAPKTVSKWQSTGHRLHDIHLLLLILLNFHDHIDREDNRFFSKGYTAISFQKLRLEQIKKKKHIIFFETFITYPVCVFVKKASWNKSQLTIHVRMIETICALKERVNYQNFHHTTSQVFLQNMVIFVKTLVFFYNPAKKQFNADKRLLWQARLDY